MPNEGFWRSGIVPSFDNLNASFVQKGTQAALPEPTQFGRLYFAEDVSIVYRDDVRTSTDANDSEFAPSSSIMNGYVRPPKPSSGSVPAWKVFFRLVQGVATDDATLEGTGEALTPLKIKEGGIEGRHIADGTITASKVQGGTLGVGSNSVDTSHIRDIAVTQAKIRNSAVGTNQIADGAVTAPKLGTNAVTAGKILASAVTSVAIANGAVTNTKIANDAVRAAHIQAGAVGNSELAANAVTSAKIADGTIVEADLHSAIRDKLFDITISTVLPTSADGEVGDIWFVR